MPRIWPAASGLRPIAVADRPARMPMPMPGPIPRGRRVRRRCAPCREFPPTPRRAARDHWDLVGCAGAARQWAGWSVAAPPVDGVERLLGDVRPPPRVALDGQDDEHERQDAEDERLDRVEHELEREQADRDERDGQRGDDAERDLAAVDVAEESHRQRDRLDELEHQLDQAHEQRDDAGADARS